METQRILVTGGKGFIGSNLVDELRKRGHEVISCDLYNTEREDYVRCDVGRYRQVERMDFSKAVRDLKHDPEVTSEEGIKRTVEWMKEVYIQI